MTTDLETIRKNRDAFLSQNPKYGLSALKMARGVKDYKELAKKLKCNVTTASTIKNGLIQSGLYIMKDGKMKRSKGLKIIGIKPRSTQTEVSETVIRTKKVRKVNHAAAKRELENYLLSNFKQIKNPYNKSSSQILSHVEIKKAAKKLIDVLDAQLDFDKTAGLDIRFYESFAEYFSKNRAKKEEMMNAFSSLIKNFEPYVKKLVFYKTRDDTKARPSLKKNMFKYLITFDSDLDNSNEDYWKDKRVIESCIKFVYKFRNIEAHEARDWDIFEMEKAIFYMFASITLINLEVKDTTN